MNRKEREDDLNREIQSHFDAEAEESGETHARRSFGNVMAVKEDVREEWGWTRLEHLLNDCRYACRRLRMAPAFTITAVLTLAIGIGATSSIFTLVHAVLLESLPVASPGELYRVGRGSYCCYKGGYSQDDGFSLVSYDLYKYLRDNSKSFSELAAMPAPQFLFGVRRTGAAESAQSYPGEFVSGNYFATFGLNAFAGRTFTADDDQPGAAPIAVMSYRLWREKYGADPSVVGSTFNINDKAFTIVGISPPRFFGDSLRSTPSDFYLPLNSEPLVESDNDLQKADLHWLNLIGRIRPGTSPSAIEPELRFALRQWLESHRGEMSASDLRKLPNQTLYVTPGGAGITSMRDEYGYWLRILMAAAAFVLLIVCANVANLMLVRGMEQRRQISVSLALGARTTRVMRQPLIESVLLSMAGGAAGLGVAFACTRVIVRLAFHSSPGMGSVPISSWPSPPVLLFAFLVSLATGVAFGIAPAWMAARVNPIEALRGAGRSVAGAGSLSRRTLVVLQTAISLVLLSAAGLLMATLRSLEDQRLGFEPAGRVVAGINPRLAGYRPAQLSQLYKRIHDAVSRVPGVSSAALCLYSPPGGGWGAGVWVDGRPAPPRAEDNTAPWDRVTPAYFETVGTRIVEGRGISEHDTATSSSVAVVNEAFVRKFFGNENPVGQHFGRRPEASREFEIVGVAEDARYRTHAIGQANDPIFFLPEAQSDYSQVNLGSLFLRDVVIATRPGASVTAAEIRDAIASVDPDLPVISIGSVQEKVADQFTQQRLIARLISLFGAVSLVLASIGLYGVTAYNAGRRVGEIGVRMALGANRTDVLGLVMRGAVGLTLMGLLAGLPLTLAAGRLLGSQLYGLSPYNPMVIAIAVAALAISALVASIVPAFRASLISPSEALRVD